MANVPAMTTLEFNLDAAVLEAMSDMELAEYEKAAERAFVQARRLRMTRDFCFKMGLAWAPDTVKVPVYPEADMDDPPTGEEGPEIAAQVDGPPDSDKEGPELTDE
jgi:hypothetical protein